MPIPDLSNKPGPGRPGWPTGGSYEFKFEVTDNVTFKAIANSAGTFSISYPDGTTTTTSGSSSITSQGGAGIISINKEDGDTTFCDEFAIVGGQTNVSKVISWGQNPWSNMYLAFDGCTSLSDISTTSFISSPNQAIANKSMIKMFNGCTSLLEADIRNWDLTPGVDWNGGSPFNGLVNLQKLDMTGMSIKILTRGTGAFASVGTAVTNGCEFLMSGINWSTSTGTYWHDFFSNAKINPNSDLSNWVFPSSSVSLNRFFRGGLLAGVNSTLNMSGWSTLSTGSFYQFFQNFNSADSPDTDQGMKINISNINVSGASSFNSMFEGCDVTEIIGLSTLGASSAANANLNKFADNARFLKFSSSDNFSNAFIASLNPSDVSEAFQYCGVGLSSNFGAAPNLTNINLSNVTSLSSTFEGAKFYDAVDLSTATFPSTGVEFFKTFKGMQTENSNTHVDFSNVSVKISNAREMFNSAYVDNVTFGNNVDFSLCTDVYRKFNNSSLKSGTINITYPTAESGLSWAALTQPYQWFTSTTGPTTGPLTTCQVDNLIRSFRATAYGSALTVDFYQSKITEAPSVVRAQEAELVANGWTITENSTDATLPFAYASYAVDPTGITTISPTTTPPAGSVFTATNSLSINSSTGVITINTFRGGTTIRCTYPDGCYNEVQMLIQVPLKLNVTIPNGGFDFAVPFKVNNSAIVQWETGGATQDVTGTTTNTYVNNTGSDKVETISIFDGIDSSTNYFKGFNAWTSTGTQFSMQIDIAQWGEPKYYDNGLKFQNCNNISITATDTPDLSQENSLVQAFRTKYGGGAASGYNTRFSGGSAIGNWDVSTITDISTMFRGVTSANFNQDLNSWNTSNIRNMSSYTFGQYPSYINNQSSPGINNWDTSNVTNMSTMFFGHNSWTGLDLSNWDTSKVTNMASMFYQCTIGATNFNTKMYNGTLRWDVSKVTNFNAMFNYGTATQLTSTTFPQNWRFASGATDNINMYQMMYNGSAVFSQTGGENFIATKTISETFYGGTSYTAWNMERVSNISQVFSRTGQLPNINIGTWQITSALTNANGAFQNYNQYAGKQLIDQDLGHWDVTGITSAGSFNQWMNNTAGNKLVEFSTANYNSLLDITDGWGQDAGSVQSGVTLNMGASKYTADGTAEQGRTALVNAGWTIVDGGAIYPSTNALSFNGSTEYVATTFTATGLTAMTISAYVYLDEEWESRGAITGSNWASNDMFGFHINSDRKLDVFIRNGGTNPQYLTANTAMSLSQWHHVAITVSNNGTNNDITFYLNGSVDNTTGSTQAYGQGQNLSATTATPYNIGNINQVNNQTNFSHFKGRIDEVMIWNNVISTGDIQAYANVIGSGSVPDPNAITGLQLWNRMGD